MDSNGKLNGSAGTYFVVPASVILDDYEGDKLVTAFSFFSVRRGLDCKTMFTLNSIAEWSGRKPNRGERGINMRLLNAVAILEDDGYISVDGEVSNTKCSTATMNMDMVSDECSDFRFAMIWLDELEKIFGWDAPSNTDKYLNNDVLLRVFSYMRMIIYRRSGKSCSDDDRLRNPEVYNGFYKDMAAELNGDCDDGRMTPRTLSKAIGVLCELGLLHRETLPRVKVGGEWRTDCTLFCNAYKRSGNMLVADGKEYCDAEINAKKMKMGIVG